MNSDFDDSNDRSADLEGAPDAVFRQFALACRAERDRIALARLDREDHDFESRDARGRAEFAAALLIAAAARR